MAIERVSEPYMMDEELQPMSVTLNDKEDTSVEMLDDGGAIVDLDPNAQENVPESGNLAESLDETILMRISNDVLENFENDETSRTEWCKSYVRGLKMLGIEVEERSVPWPGACGVQHPIIAEAVVNFQAHSISELFPADGPVLTKIIGKQTIEKLQQANRVKDYMNYLLTEELSDYRFEQERNLFNTGLCGAGFKKVYLDEAKGVPVSEFVPAEDLVVNYGTKNLETAERISHRIKMPKHILQSHFRSGFYRTIELGTPAYEQTDIEKEKDRIAGVKASIEGDTRFTLIEQHCYLDMDDYIENSFDGITPEIEDKSEGLMPYVVTIDKSSGKVLSIYKNSKKDNPYEKEEFFIQYTYITGPGFYGLGLTQLIGGMAESITSNLRQLVDTGTLSNLPGGFKTKGMKIKDDGQPVGPGDWRDVDVAAGTLKDNLLPLPYKEPSQTLLALMQEMINEARRFASLNDIEMSSMQGDSPVGTTLAVLERAMKVMTSIHSRLHYSARKEYKLMAAIIGKDGRPSYPYNLEGQEKLKREDFSPEIDIIPVTDPNASTMAQRIMQTQNALQLASTKPEMYNLNKLHRFMLNEINYKNVDEILPLPNEPQIKDPVTENMAIIKGEPVRAYIWQDHEAHIAVHKAAVDDPEIVDLVSKSPAAAAMQGAMESHIRDHIAYAYRARIEKNLGVPMPNPDDPMPQDVEVNFSKVVAEAADKTLNDSIANKKEEEIKQQLEDPILQMDRRELELKEMEQTRKAIESEKRLQLDALKQMSDTREARSDQIIRLIDIMLDAEKDKLDANVRMAIEDARNAIALIQKKESTKE